MKSAGHKQEHQIGGVQRGRNRGVELFARANAVVAPDFDEALALKQSQMLVEFHPVGFILVTVRNECACHASIFHENVARALKLNVCGGHMMATTDLHADVLGEWPDFREKAAQFL
jgi:hypothetical protein